MKQVCCVLPEFFELMTNCSRFCLQNFDWKINNIWVVITGRLLGICFGNKDHIWQNIL